MYDNLKQSVDIIEIQNEDFKTVKDFTEKFAHRIFLRQFLNAFCYYNRHKRGLLNIMKFFFLGCKALIYEIIY
jgi:hypothetical protein